MTHISDPKSYSVHIWCEETIIKNNYHMNLLAPISTIMTHDPITLHPKDTLTEVVKVFDNHNFHHIPVVQGGRLVGMVSKTDLLHFRKGFSTNRVDDFNEMMRLQSHCVEDIMTKGLAKLEETDRINVAVEVFKHNFLHALPVVDGERLVGIVSTHDIIRHLSEDKEVVKEYSSDK